jgi:CyaY protein
MNAGMSESEFHVVAERLLAAIDAAINASDAASDADIDCEINGGILTIEFADGSKAIVNRQTPLREIWLAARHGGFHFRLVDGQWCDTRDGTTLDARLNETLALQSARVIGITI